MPKGTRPSQKYRVFAGSRRWPARSTSRRLGPLRRARRASRHPSALGCRPTHATPENGLVASGRLSSVAHEAMDGLRRSFRQRTSTRRPGAGRCGASGTLTGSVDSQAHEPWDVNAAGDAFARNASERCEARRVDIAIDVRPDQRCSHRGAVGGPSDRLDALPVRRWPRCRRGVVAWSRTQGRRLAGRTRDPFAINDFAVAGDTGRLLLPRFGGRAGAFPTCSRVGGSRPR